MFTLTDKKVKQIINKEGNIVSFKKYDYICLRFKSKYIIYRRLFEEMPWVRFLTINGKDTENKENWIRHKVNTYEEDIELCGELGE